MDDLANLLMDLRRQAAIQGRTMTEQEMAGVIAPAMAERAKLEMAGQEHELATQTAAQELALARQASDRQYKMAKKQMSRDKKWMLPNALSNLGMAYLYGRNTGLF